MKNIRGRSFHSTRIAVVLRDRVRTLDVGATFVGVRFVLTSSELSRAGPSRQEPKRG